MWSLNEKCQDTVRKKWWEGKKNVKKLINELKNIRRSYDHYINRDKIKMLEKLIDNMLIDEEIY